MDDEREKAVEKESTRLDERNHDQWRTQVITQLNSFLTLAGIEMTGLAIIAALERPNLALFVVTTGLVVAQAVMTLILIDWEREAASGRNPWHMGRKKRCRVISR